MRMLLILLLLVVLGIGGSLTKPDLAAHRKHATEVLTETKSTGDVVGDLIDMIGKPSARDIAREENLEDMMVANKYTAKADGAVLIECLGVFGQFLCQQPEKK